MNCASDAERYLPQLFVAVLQGYLFIYSCDGLIAVISDIIRHKSEEFMTVFISSRSLMNNSNRNLKYVGYKICTVTYIIMWTLC